jgi:hypothetical protein
MAALAAGLMIVAIAVGAAASSCGSASMGAEASDAEAGQTSSSLSPMMEAYYRAHPNLVDGPLTPAPRAEDEIAADIRAGLDAGEEIWLPDYLPDGFVLAAPYNGDGSGSAYPNPYAFGVRYGVTYTDGVGYIMVMKNSEDDLSRGEWSLLEETVAGRGLRLRTGADITLVATEDDGEDSLLVAGAGLAEDRLAEELTRVATSLTLR